MKEWWITDQDVNGPLITFRMKKVLWIWKALSCKFRNMLLYSSVKLTDKPKHTDRCTHSCNMNLNSQKEGWGWQLCMLVIIHLQIMDNYAILQMLYQIYNMVFKLVKKWLNVDNYHWKGKRDGEMLQASRCLRGFSAHFDLMFWNPTTVPHLCCLVKLCRMKCTNPAWVNA